MVQKNPVFDAPLEDLAAVADAIGVGEADIRETGLPVQRVSCGVPYIVIPLTTREAVDRAEAGVGSLGSAVYLFTTEKAAGRDRADTYSRMFAPAIGVFEDAATGSAGGPLGSYLVKHRVFGDGRRSSFLNLQGVKMGRPSLIHIQIASADDRITDVRVGGTSVFVAEGVMEVEV
jgi:trans-2,3-dihydro-3-hydroxyanthranilate isomerase